MIIIRYIVREILKNQLSILFILLLIFFCQKLIRILGATVDGDIPVNLVLTLLGFGTSKILEIILPLSLFLSILITLSRLYSNSEITVMYACCLGNKVLIKAVMILIVFTSLVAFVNVFFIGPWSARYQSEVINSIKNNQISPSFMVGQFQKSADANSVLFIENSHKNKFNNIFISQLRPRGKIRSFIVIAEHGHVVHRDDGAEIVILSNGNLFEGTVLLSDFRITHFKKYQAIIKHQDKHLNPNDFEKMYFKSLWYSNKSSFRSELHWRFTLIFSTLIMALIVVPLSVVNPRQGRIVSMLPAMFFYLIFFLLQSSLHSISEKGHLDPALYIWIVNLIYLILGIVLNMWDSIAIHRLRTRFIKLGSLYNVY